MKYIKLIIISIVLIVVGLSISIIILATNQFNIEGLDGSLISKTYDVNEEFDSIECNLDISELNIYLTTDTINYALCLETKDITFEVKTENNVLIINEKNTNLVM